MTDPDTDPTTGPASATPALVRAAHDRFVVVLNETQDLVNIAGAVRAMMNMGIRRMRLVRPAEYDAYRIAGIAHGSEPVLEGIEFHETLREALADAVHVVGTTARRRTAAFVWRYPRDAAPEIAALAATHEGTIALVFGREDKGLSNEELDLCDTLLTIPTDPRHSSLNLAQAVLIVCYEIWLAGAGAAPRELPRHRKAAHPAGTEEMLSLFEQVENALAAIEFFKSRNPAVIMRSLRAIARRAGLDEREAGLLRAIAFEVQNVLRRGSIRP